MIYRNVKSGLFPRFRMFFREYPQAYSHNKDIEKEEEGIEYIPLWRWFLGRYRDTGDLMDRKRKIRRFKILRNKHPHILCYPLD